MHRLERRVAKLEPRSIGEAASTGAKERLLERMRRITERLSDCPADSASYRPSLAEIVAGAPCSDADLKRLRDFLGQFKSYQNAAKAVGGLDRSSSRV